MLIGIWKDAIDEHGEDAIERVSNSQAPKEVVGVISARRIGECRYPKLIQQQEEDRLAARICRTLERYGIVRTWQLVALSAEELGHMTHFGPLSVQDVRNCLAKYGLSLREE